MTEKVLELFAHKVYEVDFPNYHEIEQSLFDEVTSYFGENYSSDYNKHEHPIKNGGIKVIYDSRFKRLDDITNPAMRQVFDFITEHGKKYWDVLGLSDQLNPYILNAWTTAVRNGGFVASHNHNPIPIAGVFYIKAEAGQGNLFIENPNDLLVGRFPYRANGEYVPQRFNYEIESKSGKLVLFPGWMKHFTKENTTNDIRISMAVNFGCQGQVWITDLG
jgi:uncharacterized protein (TIGR02466 family)